MHESPGRNNRHMIDIVFTLALFCVFAASALLVVLIGANVYKSTAASMSDNFDTRTSITYISTKIRQNDDGGISLSTVDGNSALLLKQEIDGDTYCTWIYHYNGELREIFAAEDSQVSADSGQVIMKVPRLKIEQGEMGMLKFTSVDTNGKEINLSVLPRCA